MGINVNPFRYVFSLDYLILILDQKIELEVMQDFVWIDPDLCISILSAQNRTFLAQDIKIAVGLDSTAQTKVSASQVESLKGGMFVPENGITKKTDNPKNECDPFHHPFSSFRR